MDALTETQRQEAQEILSGRAEGDAAVAALELGVDEERRCPRCDTPGAISHGKARGLRRCKSGRTFNALTNTSLSRLRHKKRWLSFGESMARGETLKEAADRVAVTTAFRWHHRFLEAAETAPDQLKGIVEETYVLANRKGERKLDREARRRGGKAKKPGLSRKQVAGRRRPQRCCRNQDSARRGFPEAGPRTVGQRCLSESLLGCGDEPTHT